MKIDREFLYMLENCNSREDVEKIIEECDDDNLHIELEEHYKQILKFNKNETVTSIKNILIFVYRKYCSEN